MEDHINHFNLVDHLHDLFCRGNKDSQEALKNVKDFNMAKILQVKCSIPDDSLKQNRATINTDVLANVFHDIHLYNYFDSLLRKHKMETLPSEVAKYESDTFLEGHSNDSEDSN